jgi:hypothetical protein
MRNTCNYKILSVTLLALTFFLFTTSCDKEPKGERPELPPAELLFMDYSDFEDEPGMKKGSDASYTNFLHAYGSLLFWHSPAITIYTALPAAAYGIALAQEAEYMGDNTWKWSYDVPLGESTYVVTLTAARISNEEFSILMDVALASMPGLAVKWFDGVVRYDHTEASWTIYKEGSVAVIEAALLMNYETEAGSLQYTYVEPEMEETGSYILYEYDPQEIFDAAYTVSWSAGMTQIEWDVLSKEGRVKDEAKFEDANWHCWESYANGLYDKVCD